MKESSFNCQQPVFIPYETKTREFDGKLLLISHLLNAGYKKVYFGSRGGLKQEALNHKNGIYFFKSLSITEESFYKMLKDLGFTLMLLHAEGGIHYKDNKSSILSLFKPALLKYIDYNFVYGEAIQNDIVLLCGKEFEKKTIVSGEPRFDLLKPKYCSFFESTNDSLSKEYGDFMLINTSFGVANPFVGKDGLRSLWENEPTYSADTKRLLEKKMDFLEDVVVKYIDAIQRMADKFPDINFIIRPHPSESEATYKSAFNKHENVFVNKSGNVAEWIFAAKGVIHYDCTTGMEAVLAGKPTISFLPKVDDEILAWLPVAVSKKATTINELITDVDSIIKGSFNHYLDPKTITEWISIINNVKEEATDIIIRAMKPIEGTDLAVTKSLRNYLFTTVICLLDFGKVQLKRAKLILQGRKRISGSDQKFGKLETREVRKKLESIMMIEAFNKILAVKKKSSSVIEISNIR
jgi:surface carbohydrate biosynthesis protein